jgi:RNA polymerase sigma factor (sigma-70 family)
LNPTNRRDLRLSPEQLQVFDAHSWLIRRVWKRYAWCCPRNYLPDLLQHCRVELVKGVLNAKSGALLWLEVRDAARDFLFTRRKFGCAALKNAKRFERHLEDVVGSDDEGDIRRIDLIEAKFADAEYQHDCAERHGDRMRRLLSEALKTLDPLERKVIRLHLQDLSRPEISRRMGLSVVTVSRLKRRAVRQLRVHLRDLGYATLSPDAPAPLSGGHKKPQDR